MTTVNTHEAKTHLSRLLARVEQGEEITIARDGKPVAKLVPCEPKPRERKLGTAAGQVIIHPSFYDDMTEEELGDWYDAPLGPDVD
jgi:prevent-host-death family protein